MTPQPQPSTPIAIAIFDIDGVVRDVAGSYRRAIADTVEHFTQNQYRPTPDDIDTLKTEGCWNNDWEASRELIQRFFQTQGQAIHPPVEFQTLIDFFNLNIAGRTFLATSKTNPS